MDKVVIVLGMHRGGTSALTRGLEALAIDLGHNLKPAVPNVNDTGFFEDAGLSAINDDILALMGSRWDTLHLACLPPVDEPRSRVLSSRAERLIRKQFEHSTCFAFKDPRTCRTLPFWQDVIDGLELKPFYILCFRNPLSTARSLATRDNFSRRKSYWLWLMHMLEAARLTTGARRLFVEFESLLSGPERILAQIESFLDDERIRISVTALETYVEFLQSSLVHHSATPLELEEDPSCPELVRSVYALLLEHAGCGSRNAPDAAAQWTEYIRTFRAMAWRADLEDRTDRQDRGARIGTGLNQQAGASRFGEAGADYLPAAIDATQVTARQIAFFTICSVNYLALARTLFWSLRAHYPNAAMFIALADDPDARLDTSAQPIPLIRLSDLDLPWREMADRYGLIEFNTSIKPFVFRYLFEHGDTDYVVYLDPDIYVKSAMPELEAAFASGADVVLTPHLLEPAEYAEISDVKMLQFGIFNLGFLGLRNSPEANKIVAWWGRRTVRDCRVRLDQGLYVDQKWADLFPVYVPSTHILRHPGYNVAYWNLSQRKVELDDGRWLVNGYPLRFVHFAGQRIDDPTVFSRHSSQFDLTTIGDLGRLFDEYRQECFRNGHAHFAGIPSAMVGAQRQQIKNDLEPRSAPASARRDLRSRLEDWSRPTLWIYQQHPPQPLRTPRRRRRVSPISKSPHFAIVTPSLNSALYLRAAIDSVLDQDYAGVSYAVQDRESDDGTAELLGDYGERVSWRSEPDAGQADAINRAFLRIPGDVMACINADDVYLPGALPYVGRFFTKNPEIDVVYGHRIYIDAQGREIGRGIFPPHDSVVLKWADYLPHDTVFWRRRVWDAVGPFDSTFSCAFAWDFFLRAQASGFRFHRAPIFLTCYRVHDLQKSKVEQPIRESESQLLRMRAVDSDPATLNALNKAYEDYLRRQARFNLLYRLGVLRPG
jgi:hypothetical protein